MQPTFQIERELGLGGMGVVFAAVEPALDRSVAIKVLRPEIATAMAASRFLKEARLLARLRHPNILSIHQFGESDGLYWFAMDLVSGETLAARLQRGPLPADQVTAIARDLLGALSAAHELGIIHRDVKPANIFLDRGRALLADFSIARSLTSEPSGDETRTGEIIGTPAYMAPEQQTGEPVSPATDLYSLSLVLYECFSGRRWPRFQVPSAGDWSSIPRQAVLVLQRGLALSAGERWQAASAFQQGFTGARRRWPLVVGILLLFVGLGLVFRPSPPSLSAEGPGQRALPASTAGLNEWNRAESLYYAGQWREADLGYRRAQQIDSDCLGCDLRLLELDRWMERRSDSVRLTRLVSGIDRFDRSWQDLIRAITSPSSGRAERLRAAVNDDREFWLGWYYLGQELFNRGPLYGRHRREALEALEMVSDMKPGFAPLWYDLVLARVASGDSSGAAAALSQLMSLPPAQGLAHAQRLLAGLAFAYRFTDQGTAQWQSMRGDRVLQGIPEVAAGPRLLPGLGSPRGAVELGSAFETGERDGRLRRSGFMAQLFGLTALGRPVEAQAVGARFQAAYPGVMAEALTRTLYGASLILDAAVSPEEVSAAGRELAPLVSDLHPAAADARWLTALGRLRQGDRSGTRQAMAGAGNSPGAIALVHAALLADSGQTSAAISATDTLMLDLAAWDRIEKSPLLRSGFKLLRAGWLAELSRTDRVRNELYWHQHFHMSDYPVDDPGPAEGDWAFGTLASWQLARSLDRNLAETDVCESYRLVADRWGDGEPRYRARADTARSRLTQLSCPPATG